MLNYPASYLHLTSVKRGISVVSLSCLQPHVASFNSNDVIIWRLTKTQSFLAISGLIVRHHVHLGGDTTRQFNRKD